MDDDSPLSEEKDDLEPTSRPRGVGRGKCRPGEVVVGVGRLATED